MSHMHYISFLFQALTIIANYGAAWSKKKQNIIIYRVLSAVFNALAILFAGNVAASFPIFFTVIRNIVCFYKERFCSNKPICIITAGYIGIVLCSIEHIHSIWDIFPSAISLSMALLTWFCTALNIKKGTLVTNIAWILYYSVNRMYLSAVNMVVDTGITIISMIQIIKEQKKE